MVPFNFERRKALRRYIVDFSRKPESLPFATRRETEMGRRNVLRDMRALCRTKGFNPSPRTLQATRDMFATGYLRRGGNVFALQRVMGHSDLDTPNR
jgi:integrase/recombinase XerD